MTTFRIYECASTEHEVVKVGFSYPAFFFGWIWALDKQMNSVGLSIFLMGVFYFIVIFVFSVLTMLCYEAFEPFFGLTVTLLFLLFKVVVGFVANRLLCQSLELRGYRLIATVTAETGEQALGPYMNNDDAVYGSPNVNPSRVVLEEILSDWRSRPDLPIDLSLKEHLRRLVPELRTDLSREDWLTIIRMLDHDRGADLKAYKTP